MRKALICTLAAAFGAAALNRPAPAAVTPPPGYIYTTQLLSNTTEGCVASGPGGTFVGIGPGFTANAGAVVLAKESGELRLVVMGFNSIADCAYDAATDVLYVTDNADNGDFGIVSPFAAQTGDTVFAIPSASSASGLSAPGLELLPRGSVPFAQSVAVDASGAVFVSNAAGTGVGTVLKIVGASPSTLVSSLDFASGLAFNPANGNLFVAESLPSFGHSEINQYTAAGAPVAPVPFAPDSTAFGSYDLAFNGDGRLLASGGGVVSFDPSDGTSTPFVSGLSFANGLTVDPFTKRVEVLSSTFSGADEDKSLHRFTPISHLVPGSGSSKSECVQEFYGLTLVGKDAVCIDGAPCDADGKKDGSCLFPIGFCFDVADPNFAECTSGNVTEVALSVKPASAAIAQAAKAISSALPISNSTCVFSDGVAVPVQVAGSVTKPGTAKVKVQSTTDDGRKDTDVVKLICQPAP